MRVVIRFIESADREPFLAGVQASRQLHRPWVRPPDDRASFDAYLAKLNRVTDFGFVVQGQPGHELVGIINLSNIVRGCFQSAYLGYFAFEGYQGRGLMTQGLQEAVRYSFKTLGLHRLEANIQPGNLASIALVKACNFRQEGFSPKYLKIGGRWRDHERWAIVRGQRA